MKITLPIQRKELRGEELIKIKENKEFELDTTLVAQMRFERNFPELSSKEDLFDYSKRITSTDSLSAPVIISKMKMLYCWLDGNIDFIEFLRLFDLTDIDYIKSLTRQIERVIELVFNSSSEKN